MSYTYHGTTDLIALPNRAVQTFPSGLVRVERSFVCRKDQVAKYRNTIKVNEPMPFDDGAPAIDGLYIFPEPQEVVRDDGFVEFRVTAYGRTVAARDIGIERGLIKSTYQLTVVDQPVPEGDIRIQIFNPPSLNEIYTLRGVVESSQITSAIEKPNIENPYVSIAGDFSTPATGSISQRIEIDIVLQNLQCNAYGRWSEFVVVWEAKAQVGNIFA